MAKYNPVYTADEQKRIVDHIVAEKLFDRIKGDAIWKAMEVKKIVNRSWQSMKQHYRKFISRQLHQDRYGLDSHTRLKFYHANQNVAKRNSSSWKQKMTVKKCRCSDISNSEEKTKPVMKSSTAQHKTTQSGLSDSEIESKKTPETGTPTIFMDLSDDSNGSSGLSDSEIESKKTPETDTPTIFIDVSDDSNGSVKVVEPVIDCVVIND